MNVSGFGRGIRLVSLVVCLTLVLAPFSWAASNPGGSVDSDAVVKKGITLYQEGKFEEARQELATAAGLVPNNYAVALYLGLANYRLGARDAAVREWQRYSALSPEDTYGVGRHLSALIQEEYRKSAKETVRTEASLAKTLGRPDTVAVTYFRNLGTKSIDPVQKGMHALLINDLAKVKKLNVVERGRLQTLLDEMKLADSGIADNRNAARVGKLLKAGRVVDGSYLDLSPEIMRVDGAVLDANAGKELGTFSVAGDTARFFRVEKELAFGVLNDLGYPKSELPKDLVADLERHETENSRAFDHFSKGLDYMDKGQLELAEQEFKKALEEDKDFKLAGWYLKMLPVGVVATGALIAMIDSSAPSPAAATGAVAATAGTAAAVGTVAGISTTALVIGGAVALGAVAAVAAGGGGGGGGDSSGPVDLTGTWDFHLRCAGASTDASVISLTINQTSGGDYSGSGSGTDYTGTPLNHAISGHYSASSSSMSGTLTTTVPGDSCVREDTFSTTLSADTGYFPMTKIPGCNSGCSAEGRLVKQ